MSGNRCPRLCCSVGTLKLEHMCGRPAGLHAPAQPQSLGTGSASSLPPWGLQSEAGPPQEPRPIGGQRFEAFPHLRPLALRGTSCDGIRR